MAINKLPDDVRVCKMPLPDTVHGCIAEITSGEYVILINSNDSKARQHEALEHELFHYYNGDLHSGKTVDEIEYIAHGTISG